MSRRSYAEFLSRRRPRPELLTAEGRIALALDLPLDDPHVRLAIVLAYVLGTGSRLADEIGSPDLAWSTIPELLETLEHGAWEGHARDVDLLRGLERRPAYDLLRRILDRLVDAELVELAPASREPRDGARVYRLAP